MSAVGQWQATHSSALHNEHRQLLSEDLPLFEKEGCGKNEKLRLWTLLAGCNFSWNVKSRPLCTGCVFIQPHYLFVMLMNWRNLLSIFCCKVWIPYGLSSKMGCQYKAGVRQVYAEHQFRVNRNWQNMLGEHIFICTEKKIIYINSRTASESAQSQPAHSAYSAWLPTSKAEVQSCGHILMEGICQKLIMGDGCQQCVEILWVV